MQEDKIREFMGMVMKPAEQRPSIDELVEFVGRHYQADRSYIFERSEDGRFTVNTHEWCAEGVSPEIQNLQEVPINVVDPWMVEFRRRGAFFISVDDEYAAQEPMTYEVLEPQGITSLMAAPIVVDGDIIGFLGVDNPNDNLDHEMFLTVAANVVNHESLILKEKEQEAAYRRELEAAREAAEVANEAKTSFLFSMSHDIRTPMNAIIGFIDLMDKHRLDQERFEDYLGKVKDSSAMLLSIINNVLEMARIEKGAVSVEEKVVSAERFNDTLYSVFSEVMRSRGIEFVNERHVQHKYVHCDVTKMSQVFNNILSNASKYTQPGGRVSMVLDELPCEREGWATYRATISDTGMGMSPEFLPTIFDEFSRESTSTVSRIEGTGLGMPIAKRLVDLMGGTIEVTSTKGEGTTFTITIDLRIAPEPEQGEEAVAPLDLSTFQGKRVLLAEDNDLNAEIAMEILGEVGLLVEQVEDGSRALAVLQEAPAGWFDCVLMDIQMPIMDGYQTARAIRALPDQAKAGIPIIAMTANAFEEDRRAAVEAGMNDHVAKPIDVTRLIAVLAGSCLRAKGSRSCLARTRTGRSSASVVGVRCGPGSGGVPGPGLFSLAAEQIPHEGRGFVRGADGAGFAPCGEAVSRCYQGEVQQAFPDHDQRMLGKGAGSAFQHGQGAGQAFAPHELKAAQLVHYQQARSVCGAGGQVVEVGVHLAYGGVADVPAQLGAGALAICVLRPVSAGEVPTAGEADQAALRQQQVVDAELFVPAFACHAAVRCGAQLAFGALHPVAGS
ncbi:MAG: ATP-binding protein [Coriobacteriia bacterium]|nr:ATP-binding protein [Coriobacteriia bacterium]